MKRIVLITAAVIGLATAGLAVAHGTQSKAVKQVSGTFAATTATHVSTSTCTGTDGNTYAVSKGTYTGTATSTEPTLNGPLTADVTSLVNTTSGVGTAEAKLRIGTSGDKHSGARLTAVFSHGSIVGLATGREQANGLVANVSADYSPTSGLTNGKIGGASGGDAIEFVNGACSKTGETHPEHVQAVGAVTVLSSSSITAAGVTCAIPSELQGDVAAKVKVGSIVEMSCSVASGSNTLTKIKVKGGDAQHNSSDNKSAKH